MWARPPGSGESAGRADQTSRSQRPGRQRCRPISQGAHGQRGLLGLSSSCRRLTVRTAGNGTAPLFSVPFTVDIWSAYCGVSWGLPTSADEQRHRLICSAWDIAKGVRGVSTRPREPASAPGAPLRRPRDGFRVCHPVSSTRRVQPAGGNRGWPAPVCRGPRAGLAGLTATAVVCVSRPPAPFRFPTTRASRQLGSSTPLSSGPARTGCGETCGSAPPTPPPGAGLKDAPQALRRATSDLPLGPSAASRGVIQAAS